MTESVVQAGSKNGEIYAQLLAACRPYVAAGPWQHFSMPLVQRLPADPAAMWAALREGFGAEELAESGVAVGRDESWQLNPTLADPDGLVIGLREAKDANPFDIWTSQGGLAGCQPSILAVRRDYWLRRPDSQVGLVCAAFSIEDVAALLSAAIVAAPAEGLERIGQGDLKEFCDWFDLWESHPGFWASYPRTTHPKAPAAPSGSAAGQAAAAPAKPPHLIITGWSPARLDPTPPEGLEQLKSHLAQLEAHMDIDMGSVFLWQPSAAERETLAVCAEHGTRQEAHKAFLKSLGRAKQLLPLKDLLPPPPGRVAGGGACGGGDGAGQATTKGPAAENAVADGPGATDPQRLPPAAAASSATAEAVDTELRAMALSVSRLVRTQADALTAEVARQVQQGRGARAAVLPEDELRQLLALTNQAVAVLRELRPPKRRTR